MSARVIFSTGSLYPLDVAHCFALAAEAGFDGIEVMCDDRYSTRAPDYLQKLRDQYNLPVLVVHTPFSDQLPGWKKARNSQVERILHTLKLAETLGAESIVVHVPRKIGWGSLTFNGNQFQFPWFTPFNGVKNWISYVLPELQPHTSVKIALENMPATRIFGREVDPTWWNEMDTWSSVHQWLTLDTTHWATKCISPLNAYLMAKERVCHVHLSNYDGREHRLPHRGHLDLGNFLRTLARDGYSGTISAELHPDALEFTDETAMRRHLRQTVEFCREHLAMSVPTH